MKYVICVTLALIALPYSQADAQSLVTGGQTSVALDTDALSTAAGLTLSSVSSDVISPGSLADSVAFGINARSASTLPTTFEYNPATFPAGGSFSGTIEHSGSVLFNGDTVEVGDFTIGFDGARAGTLGGLASGFFVASNVGIAATLFDIEVTGANPLAESLTVDSNLLVSPEFGMFLADNQLSSTNLQGTAVGVARVEAMAVPEPGSAALVLLATTSIALACRRRNC